MRQVHKCGLVILVLALAGPANAVTVDFEDWTGGEGNQTSITSGGFQFTNSAEVFFIAPDPIGGNPTQSLHTRSPYGGVLTKVGGGSFAVFSLDLQEGLAGQLATVVRLTGTLNGGVVAKETFTLDGHPGTYETFYPVTFSNVDTVVFDSGFSGTTFSVDNVVVPEPCTLFLMALASCLLHRRLTLRTV